MIQQGMDSGNAQARHSRHAGPGDSGNWDASTRIASGKWKSGQKSVEQLGELWIYAVAADEVRGKRQTAHGIQGRDRQAAAGEEDTESSASNGKEAER